VTIALSLKVNDGVVLATDSASTLVVQQPSGPPAVAQVYNNAIKVFNLRKGLPIGAVTWGAGSIGRASISTLLKDLRTRFSGQDQSRAEWAISPENYSVRGVAERVKEFIHGECYVPAFGAWPTKPVLGFLVAGYSSGVGMAEEWRLDIDAQGTCTGPTEVRPLDQCGATWNGEPEAISRLILGYSPALPTVLEKQLSVPAAQIPQAMQILAQHLRAQVIADSMPIQDAIDLAYFLVDVTEKFSRYTPGAATVGGPIEVAAITKHEGFKWVERKYYYSRDLNPEE